MSTTVPPISDPIKLRELYEVIINASHDKKNEEGEQLFFENLKSFCESTALLKPEVYKELAASLFLEIINFDNEITQYDEKIWELLIKVSSERYIQFKPSEQEENINMWIPVYISYFKKCKNNLVARIETLSNQIIQRKESPTYWWPILSHIPEEFPEIQQRVITCLSRTAQLPNISELKDKKTYNLFIKFLIQNTDKSVEQNIYSQMVFCILGCKPICSANAKTQNEIQPLSSYRSELGENRYDASELVQTIVESFPNGIKSFYSVFANQVREIINVKNDPQYLAFTQKIMRLRKLTRIYYMTTFMKDSNFSLDDLENIILECTEKWPEVLRANFIFACAFDMNMPSILKHIDLACASDRLISHLAVTFSPIFLDCSEEALNKNLDIIKKRHARMKHTGPYVDFCEKANLIFDDSAQMEELISCKISKDFDSLALPRASKEKDYIYGPLRLHLHRNWLKRSKAEALVFTTSVLENFPDSAAPRFIDTLVFIQKRLSMATSINNEFIYQQFLGIIKGILNREVTKLAFRAAYSIFEATPLQYITKEDITWWNELVSKVLKMKGEIVPHAIKAAMFAMSHFAPGSFSYALDIVSAIEEEMTQGKAAYEVVIERTSLLLSLISILKYTENPNELEERVLVILETLLSQPINDIVMSCAISLMVEYSNNGRTIPERLNNFIKNVMGRNDEKPTGCLRQLASLPSLYKELSKSFQGIYETILKRCKAALMNCGTDVVIFRQVLDIVADLYLAMDDPLGFSEVLSELKSNIKKEETDENTIAQKLRSIKGQKARFVYRLNQSFSEVTAPAKRAAISSTSSNCISIHQADCDNASISTKVVGGSSAYTVQRSPPENVKEKTIELPEIEVAEPDFAEFSNKFKVDTDNYLEHLKETKENDKALPLEQLLISFQTCLTGDQYANHNAGNTSFDDTYTSDVLNKDEKEETTAIGLLSDSSTRAFYSALFGDLSSMVISKPTSLLDLAASNAFGSSTRELLKIGVLFVGKGQSTQNDILKNTWQNEASVGFKSFSRSLGSVVDLAEHKFFAGKLDTTNFSNGRYHIYFSDERYEVMFHVAPLLPVDPKDEQQIYKKRHIGNDNVHIVWCESELDYDPHTITSQFNDAHVIIYPIGNLNLFRVVIYKKTPELIFGVLHNETIVSAEALPVLARWTAIFSDRASRGLSTIVTHPAIGFEDAVNDVRRGITG